MFMKEHQLYFVDNTELSEWMSCARKAYIRFTLGLVHPNYVNEPLIVGKNVHAALEEYLLFNGYADGKATHALQKYKEFHENSFKGALVDKERLDIGNVTTVLYWFFESLKEKLNKFHVVSTENTYIDLDFFKGYAFFGILDAVVQYIGDNYSYILETKTTGSLNDNWRWQWDKSSQVNGYFKLSIANKLNVQGLLINGIEIRKLPPYDGNLNRKCSTHKQQYSDCQGAHCKYEFVGPIPINKKYIQYWQQTVKTIVTKIEFYRKKKLNDIPREGQFVYDMSSQGNMCNSCPYKFVCFNNEPLDTLKSEPWLPKL